MNKYVEYEVMRDSNIGTILDIDYLINTYQDYSLTQGFFQLRRTYPFYRPVLGDGNCFYRAIAFSFLRQADLTQFSKVFQDVENYCNNCDLRIDGRDFVNRLYKTYNTYLAPIMNSRGVERQLALTELFNCRNHFDKLMVIYLRSVNYREINAKYQKYQPYINTDKPDQVENIKRYGEEAEGLQFDAMANALNVMIVTNSVTSQGFKAYQYRGHSPTIRIDLFFRPGHYDIIYGKNSHYLQGIEAKRKQILTPMYPSPQKNRDQCRSSFYQNSPLRQSPIQERNQLRQNDRRELYHYQQSNQVKMPQTKFSEQKDSFQSQRKSFENQKSSFENQRNSLQRESNPFYRQDDQKGTTNVLNDKENHLLAGLGNLRQGFSGFKKNQNTNTLKNPSSNIMTKSLQQNLKFKNTPSDDPWKTDPIEIQEKSKIQETAIILLFFVVLGYLFFRF